MKIKPLKEILNEIYNWVVALYEDFWRFGVEIVNENWIVIGLFSGLSFWLMVRFRSLISKIAWLVIYILSWLPYLYFFNYERTKTITVFGEKILIIYILFLLMVISFVVSFFAARFIENRIDHVKWVLSSGTSRARQGKTDIRTVHKILPKNKNQYNPKKYFNFKKGYFFGINERGRPVYINKKFMMETHSVYFGPTGFGKGAGCQMRLAQHIVEGDCVICIDPKFDEFMIHVLSNEAKINGRKFIFIDLLGSVPQLNLLNSGTSMMNYELLSGGLGFSNREEASDYYQKISRNILMKFTNFSENKNQSFKSLVAEFLTSYGSVGNDERNCIESLKELASISVIQSEFGVDIGAAIKNSAVIYIKGSLRNDSVITVQKLLAIKIIQLCELNKHSMSEKKYTVLMLDEAKLLLSKSVQQIMSTARDSNISALLCMQSLKDTLDCGQDVNPDALKATITENCLVKVNYRVIDPDTREWLSRLFGGKEIDEESRAITISPLLSEIGTGERILRQTEAPLIDSNMLASLPSRCAVLGSDQLAQFVFTSPIPVVKDSQALIPTKVSKKTVMDRNFGSLGEELVDVD